MENENNLDANKEPGTAGAGDLPPMPDAMEAAPKRGRGRPRKLGLSEPPFEPSPLPGNQSAGNIGAPLWNAENCGPIGQLPFLVAGVATGWEGWALEDKEAAALAKPLADVLNILVPAGGQYASMVALSSTLLVVFGMKYKGYREHLAKVEADNAGVTK